MPDEKKGPDAQRIRDGYHVGRELLHRANSEDPRPESLGRSRALAGRPRVITMVLRRDRASGGSLRV
jgi:hypothetical protein